MSIKLPDDPVLKALLHKVEGQIEDLTIEIAKGACKDFADYKKKCGVIQGLEDALGWLEVIARDYHLEDDGGY
jgi:hypothetical protein